MTVMSHDHRRTSCPILLTGVMTHTLSAFGAKAAAIGRAAPNQLAHLPAIPRTYSILLAHFLGLQSFWHILLVASLLKGVPARHTPALNCTVPCQILCRQVSCISMMSASRSRLFKSMKSCNLGSAQLLPKSCLHFRRMKPT